MYVSLDAAKKHLNIEEDYHEDDQYIMGLIEAAEQAVRVHTNDGELDEIAEKHGGCLPNPLLHAMLLMVGNLYQNREVVGPRTVTLPYNYEYLIDLYKNYNR